MPSWRYYDGAAKRFEVGLFSKEEFARTVTAIWLLPGYAFRADIPNYDLTHGYTVGGVRQYPTTVDPYFHTPKFPADWINPLLRNTIIPQNFHLPGGQTQQDLGKGADQPNHNSLFGEDHLWHDTWNNKVLWRCPNVRWEPPGNPMPSIQHLIFFSSSTGEPMMLLSLDNPIAATGAYEFDWASGLFGSEEDRFGIILEIVEA